MDNQKREFTGVWIPRHVIEDEELSMTEKILYSEIACFVECTKSNESLGNRYNLKANTVSIIVSKLIKKGYVVSLGVEGGRFRKLVARRDDPNQRHPLKKIKGTLSEKSKGAFEKNQTIDNSIDNIKSRTSFFSKSSELPERTIIPIDEDGLVKKENPRAKESPLGALLIRALKQEHGISHLDGGNNARAASEVAKKFKDECDKRFDSAGETDVYYAEQFSMMLRAVFAKDDYYRRNATSMRFINNNLIKMINLVL